MYQIVCGPSNTEILGCITPVSQLYETWGDYYSYCFPTYPIQSNTNPSPIFPYNGNDKVQFGYTNFIGWDTSFFLPNISSIASNKITIVIETKKYSSTLNYYKKQFFNDVSTCKINFFNRVSNDKFESVNGIYFFMRNFFLIFIAFLPYWDLLRFLTNIVRHIL